MIQVFSPRERKMKLQFTKERLTFINTLWKKETSRHSRASRDRCWKSDAVPSNFLNWEIIRSTDACEFLRCVGRDLRTRTYMYTCISAYVCILLSRRLIVRDMRNVLANLRTDKRTRIPLFIVATVTSIPSNLGAHFRKLWYRQQANRPTYHEPTDV